MREKKHPPENGEGDLNSSSPAPTPGHTAESLEGRHGKEIPTRVWEAVLMRKHLDTDTTNPNPFLFLHQGTLLPGDSSVFCMRAHLCGAGLGLSWMKPSSSVGILSLPMARKGSGSLGSYVQDPDFKQPLVLFSHPAPWIQARH